MSRPEGTPRSRWTRALEEFYERRKRAGLAAGLDEEAAHARAFEETKQLGQATLAEMLAEEEFDAAIRRLGFEPQDDEVRHDA